MANFSNMKLTDAGRELLGEALTMGKSLIIESIVVGDGNMPAGQTNETMTAMVSLKYTLPIISRVIQPNGTAIIRARLASYNVPTGFFIRELGVMAHVQGGPSVLYHYDNAGAYPGYMPANPAKNERDLVVTIYIGNLPNVIINIGAPYLGRVYYVVDEAELSTTPKIKYLIGALESRSAAVSNEWHSVCYGAGLFVAVSGLYNMGNRVMTSPDGNTWTSRVNAVNNTWHGVCYGNGLFVAVAIDGAGNRVMTSPDGITWTSRVSAADNDWMSVCYGNGLFVAVAISGAGNRVMTSPDGITWTARVSAADNQWRGVCYGNGLFVAVANNGTGNRVMTSPNGITWTARSSPADVDWGGVCYGNGIFVAVSNTYDNGNVMTSPDGITWTMRPGAPDYEWRSVCFYKGLFIAVASRNVDKAGAAMYSHNGINWTWIPVPENNQYLSVCCANDICVAVADTGTYKVMRAELTAVEVPAETDLTLQNCDPDGALTVFVEGMATFDWALNGNKIAFPEPLPDKTRVWVREARAELPVSG